MSINKNTCIEEIKNKSIHPLLNTLVDDNSNNCLVLPQYEDNILTIIKNTNNLKLLNKQEIENKINFFSLPINSNNFLEIVFSIKTINDLDIWLNTVDYSKLKVINTVFSLYWKYNYESINDNLDIFININNKLIKNILHKNINDEIINKIINRLIKKNYGKNIKYIDKIKKYLMIYI